MRSVIRRTYVPILFLFALIGCSAHNKLVKKPTEQKPTAEVAQSTSTATSDLDAATTARPPLKTVYFAYDQHRLTEEARADLKANVLWLKAHPRSLVKVEGRCDERGTAEYNVALGQERADAVKKYYEMAGIKSSSISTISYGKEKPVCSESTESCRQQNRQAGSLVIPPSYASNQ